MKVACEICGGTRGLDRHHILHRRMGGSKDPVVHDHANLLTICRTCHIKLHEGPWRLEQLAEGIRIVDRRTGQPVMRRLRSAALDPAALFRGLALIDASFVQVVDVVPYLSDDELLEAFSAAVTFGKRAWLVQAAILHEAQQRSTYGDKSLEAIARRFDISLRQAEKYALVWKTFFQETSEEPPPGDPLKHVNIDAVVLDEPSWYVVAASESPDPQTWLTYAQDRKLEDPRYSVAAFRRDIRRARRLAGTASADVITPSSEGPSTERLRCPWVRLFCTRSGRPIPVAACTACDTGGTDHGDATPQKPQETLP